MSILSLDQLQCVYVCTNEKKQRETLDAVKNYPEKKGNAIVGTSGFFVLNLASTISEVSHVVLFDLSDRVAQFWHGIKEILQDPELSLAKAKERIPAFLQARGYGHIGALNEEIKNQLSWLSSEDRFEKIHQIFLKNRFSFAKIDMGQPEEVAALFRKNEEIVPLAVYISNIAECPTGVGSTKERHAAFCESLKQIPEDAIVIDSAKEMGYDVRPTQRVHLPGDHGSIFPPLPENERYRETEQRVEPPLLPPLPQGLPHLFVRIP